MNIIYSHWFYLIVLLAGIGGLVLADFRFKLVFFYRTMAAIKTIGILMILLLVADVVGIKLGIFFTNQSYVSGWYLVSRNLPVEELVFLFLLGYVTLMVYRLANKWTGSLDDARDDRETQ